MKYGGARRSVLRQFGFPILERGESYLLCDLRQ